MAKLAYKTRGMTNPQGKQKIYFSCHPSDFDKYFEKITDEILEKQNCAIWYDEDSKLKHENIEYDESEWISDLSQMQLFVIPITSLFLYEKNRALDVEFKYAMEHHIPILPIMQESGLVNAFNEICGDLQWLDPYLQDETAISYDEKLDNFLNTVLVGEELAEKIREIFDAYIFLSYRKKDRRYAQELMRLIHKNEFCRDIAIWYDEFLTPGENFNKAIEAALKKSGLFALVVTPNLVNEENYVMTTEYPMAKALEKIIFPAEMIETNKHELQKKYEGIPDCANTYDEKKFFDDLLLAVKQLALKESKKSPEHNFFIGLAYLKGIDVEVNHERAKELITGAAETGLKEAIEKLVQMYCNGEGVERNYWTAVEWLEKLKELCKADYETQPTAESGHTFLFNLMKLGNLFLELTEIEKAQIIYEECVKYAEEIAFTFEIEQNWQDLSICYGKLAKLYRKTNRLQDAMDIYEKDLKLCIGLQEKGFVNHLRDISKCYDNLGSVCYEKTEYQRAKAYFEEALKIRKKIVSESTEPRRYEDIAVSYHNLGAVSSALGEKKDAEEYLQLAIAINEKLVEEQHSVVNMRFLFKSYDNMGELFRKERDFKGALPYYEKGLEIKKQIAEELESIESFKSLAKAYEYVGTIHKELGNSEKTREYYENALTAREKLAQLIGTIDSKATLLGSLSILGSACFKLKDLQGAKKCMERMQKTAEEILLVRNTDEDLRNLAVSKIKLGNIYQEENELEIAWNYHMEALQMMEGICQRENTLQSRRDISVCYMNLGDICKSKHELKEACKYYTDSFQIRKSLYEEERTTGHYRDCAIMCRKLIDMHRLEANIPEMLKWHDIFCSLAKVK